MNPLAHIAQTFFTQRKLKVYSVLLICGTSLLLGLTSFFSRRDGIKIVPKSGLYTKWRGIGRDGLIRKNFTWESEHNQPPWHPEYLGKANMHIFEDWCGTNSKNLRKNVLFPLYPHTRTTVRRLAVSPQWNNYGLRIFGYIHPGEDGDYLFALASDDTSEFWLSANDSPLHLQALAYVGVTGTEWTAPGEFDKFINQISHPVTLKKDQRYYFEVILKQATSIDHVEVAWRLNQEDTTFEIIGSSAISLYTDESTLKMSEVDHIPQSLASHEVPLHEMSQSTTEGLDMLKEDPRDTIYNISVIDSSLLRNVLPNCPYKPSYIVREYHVGRYQGLQHVFLSSVYPNDHTRLASVDVDGMCFYKEDPLLDSNLSKRMKILALEVRDVEKKEKADVKPAQRVAEANSNNTEPEAGLLQKSDVPQIDFPVPHVDLKKSKPPSQAEEENVVYEDDAAWERVFDVLPGDFHSRRSDANTKLCRHSGNLVLNAEVALPVVKAFMKKLNKANRRQFALRQVLNVERRFDKIMGSRFLVELELAEEGQANVLLSKYIYVPRMVAQEVRKEAGAPEPQPCYPQGFSWNPQATVHVIVPVKNQARWVKQLIMQMEKVYEVTEDKNFNIIIIDYSSNDIDVEKELQQAVLPSYQYQRLEGSFSRSAGLQAGIDLIHNDHSIAFLCDLHLHFPPHLIDSIRKHCVEGKSTFAPIVMRLDCGASPQEPYGFWETAGYGLMAIYKSDMVRIGGMNTEEFKDKWGGEDWEMLDRIIRGGLEVERLHIRNFLHFFHSKRGMWNNRIRKMV